MKYTTFIGNIAFLYKTLKSRNILRLATENLFESLLKMSPDISFIEANDGTNEVMLYKKTKDNIPARTTLKIRL
jgi:hypothetical protein